MKHSLVCRRHCFALILGLCGLPLSGLPAQVQPRSSRDSAGAKVTEYASLRDLPIAFKFATTPFLRLGGLRDSADEELSAAQPFLAPVVLSNHEVAVSDWASIRYFSSKGRYLRSVGGRGLGPGEFTQLRRVCRLGGDTLLAIDYSDGRLSLWSPEGRLIRAWARVGSLAPQPCFADGTLLVIREPIAPAAPNGSRRQSSAHFARVRPDGSIVSEIGWLPVERYGPVPKIATVAAVGDRIIAADGVVFEIRSYSGTGVLEGIVRVNDATEVMSAEARRASMSLMRLGSDERFGAVPSYGQIQADLEGNLWVRGYLRMDTYSVFDNSLRLLGTVTLPPSRDIRTAIVGFGDHSVAVRTSDDDGAPIIVFYRISRQRE